MKSQHADIDACLQQLGAVYAVLSRMNAGTLGVDGACVRVSWTNASTACRTTLH